MKRVPDWKRKSTERAKREKKSKPKKISPLRDWSGLGEN
jgi:hypothetical protein